MQDIQSPFGPIKGPGATPKTYVVTTPQQLFNVIQQWLATSENAKTLKNFQDVIELMMSKINDLINQKVIISTINKSIFAPLPDNLRREFERNFGLMWERGKSLNDILQNLKDAVNKQDTAKAAELLSKFTAAQVDKDPFVVPGKLQQAINEALKPFLKEGVDESLLKLYFTDLAARIAKQYGHSLPNMKESILEKLQNQLLTMPDQATLFKDSSAKLLNFLRTPEGEKMLVMLVGGEQAAIERDKVKNSLKALAANASARKSLQASAETSQKLTEDDEFEKAKAEDVASKEGMVYLKQIIDPAFEAQIAAMQKLIDTLTQAFPNDPRISLLKTTLKQISDDYQAGTLDYSILSQLETNTMFIDLINKLPNVEMRVKSLNVLLTTLKEFQSLVKNGDKALTEAIAKLQKNITDAKSTIDNIKILNDLLQKLLLNGSANTLSQAEYQAMSSAYLALMSQMPNLGPDDQKAINNITELLKSITATNTSPAGGKSTLFQIMIDSNIWAIIDKYKSGPDNRINAANMHAMQKEIQDYLNKYSDMAKTNSALLPFVNILSQYVPLDDLTKGSFNIPFIVFQYGYYKVNPMPVNGVYDRFSTTITNVLKALADITTKFNQTLADLSKQLVALQNSAKQLSQLIPQAINDAIENIIRKTYVWTHSLPDDFAEVIINRFMPAQEAKLWALANLLAYYNMNASQDNQFISAMKGWDLSQTDFNCGGTTPQSQDCLSTEWTKVKERLAQINDPATGMLKKIADAKADLAKALKDGKITQEQYDGRMKFFVGDPTATPPVKGLDDKLKSINIELTVIKDQLAYPTGGSPPPYGNVDKDSEAIMKGLLQDFYGAVDGDATKYTSLGQAQQMTLQLTMTQIQQEWTVVTTCMQMLNQMYMTIARGIKGG